MAGRKSKLDSVQKEVIAALKTGATIADVCAHAGIALSTYYEWLARGGAEPDSPFSEFMDAATRAQADAKATAIKTLYSAMTPTQTVRRTKHTVTETRQNAWGKEFTYVKTDEDELIVVNPGDWRAAVEYLKRRHYDEWGDKARVDDWRSQAIVDIKAGRLPYAVLVEAFDESLAAQLYQQAGVPISSESERVSSDDAAGLPRQSKPSVSA